MATVSTLKLENTIDWAKRLNFGRQSAIGNSLEPAITSANMVKQTMLSAPFAWWWNSKAANFDINVAVPATITNTVLTSGIATYTATAHGFNAGQFTDVVGTTNGSGVFNVQNQPIVSVTANTFSIAIDHINVTTAADTGTATLNTQDYLVNIPDFSWIDNVSLKDTNGKWMQIQPMMSLAKDSVQARPREICPLNQDETTGDITFRVMPSPNVDYPVQMIIQQSAVLFDSLEDSWAPIPDYLSYIYNWGFLALMMFFADDPRWAVANQKFVASLLGAAQGLDENDRNIFLNNWNALTTGQQIGQQQGYRGRES